MDKEQIAIQRLQTASEMSLHYYQQPLIITDSGGKDSSVCKQLAIRAGIPFEVMHNHTTADAPETVRFVRQEFKRLEDMGIKCTINMPVYKGQRTSMWELIPQKLMPPTRFVRYCCSVLKESGGKGRFIATGVRWDESASRRKNRGIYEKLGSTPSTKLILNNDNDEKRLLFENCRIQAKRVVNPIIDWTDDDVFDYLEETKSPMNPLYCEGQSRVGCIGCPLASRKNRIAEFNRWPQYKLLYLNAFDRMIAERYRRGKMCGEMRIGYTAEDVFNWWMENDVLPGQLTLDGLIEASEDGD